tara:strand:- start:27899 stop:29200 length:1302 start_codon:yes stop_codon:yes gene_type:complete
MFSIFPRVRARFGCLSAILCSLIVWQTQVLASKEVPLGLQEAADLAVTGQPLLEGLDAQAQSAREMAVAASQLPDPQLKAGVTNLPANTDSRFSLSQDFMTMTGAGLMQEFPRAEKRRLRGELMEREAQRIDAERELTDRRVRRDAALAWLEAWRAKRTLGLRIATLQEARAQQDAVAIALKTGGSTQADYLAARQEADRLRDDVAAAEQGTGHAQATLSRWLGNAAFRSIAPDLPVAPPLPDLDIALERIADHPLLTERFAAVAQSETGAALAQADYKPDWRVELGYAYRPNFSEMLMLQVGVDLPVFTRNRQDRRLAAALAQKDSAESAVEDQRRQLQAEVRHNHHDVEQLSLRLRDYEQTLLPQSEHRITAALSGWRSGRNALREVLEARRAALEVQLAALDLQFERAQHVVQLNYLGAFSLSAAETGHE